MKSRRVPTGQRACVLIALTSAVLLSARPGFAVPYHAHLTCEGQGDVDGYGSIILAGDVNGDGFSDMVVNGQYTGTDGEAYVYFGGPLADETPDLVLSEAGLYDGDQFSTGLALADVNGDGHPDILAGAQYYDNGGGQSGGHGRVYLFFGGPSIDATPDLLFTGTVDDGLLGCAVSTAGDVNGDGFDDVIVGERHFADTQPGHAYLYLGGLAMDNVADLVLTIGQNGDNFGNRVGAAGDVNADGFDDFLVGADRYDGSAIDAGRVQLYLGSASPDGTADLVLDGEAASDFLGRYLGAAGDVNGDGYEDFVVGAWANDAAGEDAGRVYIHFGGASLDGVADVVIDGEAAGANLIPSVRSFGDVNEDGYSDLLLGAPYYDGAVPDIGRAYLHLGAATPDASPDLVIEGDPSYTRFGWGKTMGDVTGDGRIDLLVGSAGFGSTPGRAGVFTLSPVSADPSATCISTVHTCVTVPMEFERFDTQGVRGTSVTFELSPELELCGSITQGDWLSGFGTNFQVVDEGGGIYTVDQAIIGLPCGITTGGTLFELPLQKTAGVTSDAVGTVTVNSVTTRDCLNHPVQGSPGAVADVLIDITAPDEVADLSTTQKKAANDTDGTTEITVNFAAPVDADETFVFRKGYGDYPEYDDGTGSVPTLPATPTDAVTEGWAQTSVTAPGQPDDPGDRDFYYYVVFTEDACDNVSLASNLTGGTLSYHLGDVSDGGTAGQGDNAVTPPDFSLLGAHYGITLAPGDSVNYLDVGPTADYSVDTLPTTDNEVGFEDLMMFAINYEQVTRSLPVAQLDENPTLVIASHQEGEIIETRIALRNHTASVKGIHTLIGFDHDALEVLEVTQGELLQNAGPPVFFDASDKQKGCVVDAAILGSGTTLQGTGDIATLRFRIKGKATMPQLLIAELRDPNNESFDAVDVGQSPVVTQAPTTLELIGARPNPFDSQTEILFRLPSSERVTVNIYDVSGRLVRTITDRTLPVGEHRSVWDGRNRSGSPAGAGIYFYTFQAGELRETRKLLHVR